MAKVIILNGPPGCGKDTIAGIIADRFHALTYSFKTPMFEIAKAMLGGVAYEKFMDLYNNRDTKEVANPLLNNRSPRDFMIWISESVIKPDFGKGHFGKLAADSMDFADQVCGYGQSVVVSDGGFVDEVLALVNRGHDVTVIRLHREGFTFKGDSRNYIRINPYHRKNGYAEFDVALFDGQPERAAGEIMILVNNK